MRKKADLIFLVQYPLNKYFCIPEGRLLSLMSSVYTFSSWAHSLSSNTLPLSEVWTWLPILSICSLSEEFTFYDVQYISIFLTLSQYILISLLYVSAKTFLLATLWEWISSLLFTHVTTLNQALFILPSNYILNKHTLLHSKCLYSSCKHHRSLPLLLDRIQFFNSHGGDLWKILCKSLPCPKLSNGPQHLLDRAT